MLVWEAGARVRVLGIDPGLTRCGLGLIDGGPARRPVLVAVDVVRTSPDTELGARLLAVENEVGRWLEEYHPDTVALERVFSQHNVRTVMGTAQVSGVIMAAAARRGVPVALHTPSEAKAAVTGSGRADKAQVTQMVTRILTLPERPKPADAADALALAICQLWRGPATERLGERARAETRQRPRRPRARAEPNATMNTAGSGTPRWPGPRAARAERRAGGNQT